MPQWIFNFSFRGMTIVVCVFFVFVMGIVSLVAIQWYLDEVMVQEARCIPVEIDLNSRRPTLLLRCDNGTLASTVDLIEINSLLSSRSDQFIERREIIARVCSITRSERIVNCRK